MADDEDPFAELRDSFRPRLAERLGEIEAAFEAARAAAGPEPLRLLHRLVHSLAGAAGTFGYPEVSAASRPLERRAKELLEGSDPGDREELAPLLAALRRAAAAA